MASTAAILEFANAVRKVRLMDGMSMYGGGLHIDIIRDVVQTVTQGRFTAEAGSDELDYRGEDSSQHFTFVRVGEPLRIDL